MTTARIPQAMLDEPRLAALMALLSNAGHRALIVGGAVRNALMGLPAEDIDLSTDADPRRVTALAEGAGMKVVPTGLDHGTVTVVSGGKPFEVTTFRRDVETDGRHAIIAPSDRIEDDAARRDFTMNALYAGPDGLVIDPTGLGLADLRARILRFVGDPDARIAEDYLRILRFFRFHAGYGHAIDPAALAATARQAGGIATLSRERVGGEMRKLLAAPDPTHALNLMAEAGVLAQVMPMDLAALPALISAEARSGAVPDWGRRLALLAADEPTAPMRLGRAEAARHARLRSAGQPDSFSPEAAGYRLGAADGRDAALIAGAQGAALPADWLQRVQSGAAAPLPISAADLAPMLQGKAMGTGLRAAETLWVASRFTLPAAALIEAARTAARESQP